MTRALVLLVVALPLAALDGTVVNKTTGKPAAGATVTLYQMGQGGMSPLETVRAGQQGKFAIAKAASGPRLLQTIFDGVVYSQVIQQGAAETGVAVEVYSASKQPGAAQVAQHMLLLEPSGGQLNVSEAFIFNNSGNTTYNNPQDGTLRFWLPEAAKGIVQVNATSPGGMPVQRAAEKTAQPNVYKIDFPIKPGETRIDLRYLVPFTGTGAFEGKVLYKGQGPTRLVTPGGVTLEGDNIKSAGAEPQTQANIYDVTGSTFKVAVQGSGTLQQQDAAQDNNGPEIESIMPKVWENAAAITALAFGILALGFILLYRAQPKA